jgi:hypothetical protein
MHFKKEGLTFAPLLDSRKTYSEVIGLSLRRHHAQRFVHLFSVYLHVGAVIVAADVWQCYKCEVDYC